MGYITHQSCWPFYQVLEKWQQLRSLLCVCCNTSEDMQKFYLLLNPHSYSKGGGIVETNLDLITTNVLTPHPIYAWMSWVCILSPSKDKFEEIYLLIIEAHHNAIGKFKKKVK